MWYEIIGARTRPIKLPRARVPVWREFIVRAGEKLTAFLELQRAIHELAVSATNREGINQESA